MLVAPRALLLVGLACLFPACGSSPLSGAGGTPPPCTGAEDAASPASDAGSDAPRAEGGGGKASLPLVEVADVPLPGKPVRWDYQDIDYAKGHLVIAHMDDASVVIVNLADGSTVKVVPNVPTARGIIVADDVGRIFVSSSPDQLVIIDNDTLAEIGSATTGNAPDGVGWDPADQIVGVSDQGDGAISLIKNAGSGSRTQVPLGVETGNVVYDACRGVFWAAVVSSSPPDVLASIDPVAAKVKSVTPLPGCSGAHGLRISPDGKSAFVACELNSMVARVDLTTSKVDVAASGPDPDVMAMDPGLGWIYVAAESGTLKVFDMNQPGLVAIDTQSPGTDTHSVAVDRNTHHVFFPIMAGPTGTPILRIMKPAGT